MARRTETLRELAQLAQDYDHNRRLATALRELAGGLAVAAAGISVDIDRAQRGLTQAAAAVRTMAEAAQAEADRDEQAAREMIAKAGLSEALTWGADHG